MGQGTYRNILETHANDEVARPVGETSHSHGCWARSLAEELGHNEPGDGARANLKECHKAKDGHNGDIAHGWNPLLGAGRMEDSGQIFLDLTLPSTQRTETYPSQQFTVDGVGVGSCHPRLEQVLEHF